MNVKMTVLSFLLFTFMKANSQIPKDVPHPNTNSPVDFSKPEDIVLFIALPLLIIVLFFVWRKKRRKK
ncbi:hypothetical protein SAMN05421855_102496 [Ulvibacter litoralis]|uniref:Adenylosuccinate synthetase n=1 Tax=Ulvibacter litoralis TaxID=227084 RepID=A0A1G7FER7_9FLAO|nr:hypothetical protein GCM10008083_14080 [Ulvibacter litoralis]SDE74035.1 hypothetical protein SAMN05421855_102496 [Ulvibacter litoralis]